MVWKTLKSRTAKNRTEPSKPILDVFIVWSHKVAFILAYAMSVIPAMSLVNGS